MGVCVLVAGLGIADGTAQGALVGDLSFMDPTYIQVWLNRFLIWSSGDEEMQFDWGKDSAGVLGRAGDVWRGDVSVAIHDQRRVR